MDTRNQETRHGSAWVKFGLILLMMSTGVQVKAASAGCEVLAVTDGDTLSVVCENQVKRTVRLADIEGPPRQALFRARAERNLSDLLLHQRVTLEMEDVDTGSDPVAQVYLGSIHVNASVVGAGMAVCTQQSTPGGWCEVEESRAKSGLRGVWSDPWLQIRAAEGSAPAKRRQAT